MHCWRIAGISATVLLGAACARLESDAERFDRVDGFRCHLVLNVVGPRILSDSAAHYPDPTTRMARDSRGRLFISPPDGERIAVWSGEGKLLSIIGRAGEGPGEFSRGSLVPIIVPGDSLYVRSSLHRWSVFGPDLKLVRELPKVSFAGTPMYTKFLDNGRILSTKSLDSRGGRFLFEIINRDGSVARGLAPRTAAMGDRVYGGPSAYAGGSDFWVSLGDRPNGGYTLERWDLTGKLMQTLIRNVPWYPKPSLDANGQQIPYPNMIVEQVDSEGFLLTEVRSLKVPWRAEFDSMGDEQFAAYIDVRHELIDPQSREVLASAIDNPAIGWPHEFFPRSRVGARWISQESTGLEGVELVEYQALDSAGGGCKRRAPAGSN